MIRSTDELFNNYKYCYEFILKYDIKDKKKNKLLKDQIDRGYILTKEKVGELKFSSGNENKIFLFDEYSYKIINFDICKREFKRSNYDFSRREPKINMIELLYVH